MVLKERQPNRSNRSRPDGVFSVERVPELAQEAALRLGRLNCRNVEVRTADGTLGLADAAPFDGIVVTAGGTSLPHEYVEQLSDGGRIVIPLGESPRSQTMFRYTLRNQQLETENLGAFAFVPLIGRHGWSDAAGA